MSVLLDSKDPSRQHLKLDKNPKVEENSKEMFEF